MGLPTAPAQDDHLTSGPSPHLSWSELDCHSGVPYPRRWLARATALAREFEAVRALCGGRPIRVLSGYRTTKYNRQVGGAVRSQHIQGRALDITGLGTLTLAELQAAVVEMTNRPGRTALRGLGIYPTFIHIDIRPSRRVVRWSGSRPTAELTGR